jgi:hypothetical protein
MAVARSTATSRRNSSGQLELVPANQPAFHWAYDGTFIGLQCYSGGSANRTSAADPENIATGGWSNSNVNFSANAITDPYGTASAADTITDDNDSVTKNCYIMKAATCDANDPIEVAAFVKVETLGTGNNYFYMDAGFFSGVLGGVVWDLEDPLGTPILVEVDVDRYGVEQYAGGWYRFWMEVGVETDTNGQIYFGLCNSASASTPTYPHDGRSIGIWGCTTRQLDEVGTNNPHQAPLPYTAASIMQRDNLSISDISWYSDAWANFSYYQEWYLTFDTFMPSTDRYSLHIDTSTDASAYVELSNSKVLATLIIGNSPGFTGTIQMLGSAVTPGVNRCAFTVADSDLRGSFNASAVVQDATITWPRSDATTSINFDWSFGGGRPLEGFYRHIIFYDNDLTNAELLELSTNGIATAFPGTIAGDGGVMWPARSNDPRWAQLITDSGITPTGSFQDDVKRALIALSGASGGSMDDLWKKTLAVAGVTDISEPYLY